MVRCFTIANESIYRYDKKKHVPELERALSPIVTNHSFWR